MDTIFFIASLLLHVQLSSADTFPNEYFINCGSDSDVPVNGRTFTGDSNPGSLSFSVGQGNPVKNPNPPTDPSLYHTARVFRQQSSYEFDISTNGTYLVRLHFFVFSSSNINLADALFNVSASGFWLLSNFSVRNTSNSSLIKEYLLTINVRKFNIYFIPSQESSLAFVNALEVFLSPDKNLIPNDAPHVTDLGQSGDFLGLQSQVLHKIHGINVGGDTVNPENDWLWRNWIPDDDYLVSKVSAKNCVFYSGRLNFLSGLATRYSAPELVYRTCKELSITDSLNLSNIISWRFDVSKNARHLVRAHFCDLISASLNVLNITFYVYSKFSKKINLYDYSDGTQSASPFYIDFVVDSDASGFMNISVGPREDSVDHNAFLNGLEIMEFMKGSDWTPAQTRRKKRNLFVIVGSIGGGVFVSALVVFLLGLKHRKRKLKSVETVGSPSTHFLFGRWESHSQITDINSNASPLPNLNLKLKMPFVEILDSTDNFDAKLLIGEGGFGKVYKGTLHNGMKVAVKRSNPKHGQGLPEFHTEIMVLSKIRHRHLVSLIGYCNEGSEMILVYEFMEKGTLREHLYNLDGGGSQRLSSRSELSWMQRLEICIGAAEGLHYLHTGSDGGIIHRDVKSTNILLDENYVAKVADFGLSKSGPPDPDHCSMGVKGSFGYLDPEYFRSLRLTDKSDVYSFGVVLLEVLCARPAIINSPQREEVNLADWGLFCLKKGKLEEIVDPFLVGKINPNSFRKFGETAEKCLKANGDDRPTMRDVLWDLQYALQLQKTAVKREPHEDSTTDASLELPLPVVQRLPSDNIPIEEDDVTIGGDDGSETSVVFSQLRIGSAR